MVSTTGTLAAPKKHEPRPVRSRRSPQEKYDERRNQLAESALRTLGELGYARTSLREIANNSEFTHGVVHYYFHDKLELIIHCVRYYKAHCVNRYDVVIAESMTPAGLVAAFAAKLAETIREEAPMHRLWYDLRTQSMFEEDLIEAVVGIDQTLADMVWRVIGRYSQLSNQETSMTPAASYGALDGIFQQALLGHIAGRDGALDELVDQVEQLMPHLLTPSH